MKHQVWMLRLLLLILLPSSYSYTVHTVSSRVVGGTQAAPGQFPYMAVLKRFGYSCSATIISKRWVISAAHCVEKSDPKLYTVTAGVVDLNREQGHAQMRNVSRLISHSKFMHFRNDTTDTAIFDICLVQVEKSFVWNKYINPIHLACISVSSMPTECMGVGFGLRNVSEHRRKSLVPPNSHRRLNPPEKLNFLGIRNPVRPCPELNDERFPENHQLCSIGGAVGERHIYLGDSGGPLVCRGLQFGVFSTLEPTYGARNKTVIVQVHTSVPYFYKWVLENMPVNGRCDGLKLTFNTRKLRPVYVQRVVKSKHVAAV